MNITIVRAPGEMTNFILTNLTAYTRYFVTIIAFTGPVEQAASDGKAIGPFEFQTLEESMWKFYVSEHLRRVPVNMTKYPLLIINSNFSAPRTQRPSQERDCNSYPRRSELCEGYFYPSRGTQWKHHCLLCVHLRKESASQECQT